MVRAVDMKYEPHGVLAAIVGTKKMTRGAITAALWKEIKKEKLQGAEGDTVMYKRKKYKGGQVIHVGRDPDFKELCGGKKKIAMFELATFMSKYMDLVD
jgi:chromatin remodeling complex protein RSC6